MAFIRFASVVGKPAPASGEQDALWNEHVQLRHLVDKLQRLQRMFGLGWQRQRVRLALSIRKHHTHSFTYSHVTTTPPRIGWFDHAGDGSIAVKTTGQRNFGALYTWLRDHGAVIDKVSVRARRVGLLALLGLPALTAGDALAAQVAVTEFEGMGNGLQAQDAIAAGDQLLSIPEE